MATKEAAVPPRSRKVSIAEPQKRGLFKQMSRVATIWESSVASSTAYSTFLVTFQAVFNASTVWQWALIYIFDAIYLASIVLRFATGFKKRGVVVTGRKEIALKYLKTSFIPDLLSILPLEVFSFFSSNVALTASYLRLNRCIRCYKVWTFLSGKEKELGTNTALLMALRFTFLAWLSIHTMACVWFASACCNSTMMAAMEPVDEGHGHEHGVCKPGMWSDYPQVDWDTASDLQKYIVTLYWSVTTITSVGYGDILPTTYNEKWLSTLFMLWGIVLFGYILGGLASMLTNSDAQRSRYIHRLNTIRDNLTDGGITDVLRKKVIGYYEYLWQRNKGKSATDLFDELPLAFQAELSLETYRNMIEKSSLFHGAPEEFMRMLSLVVHHTLYLPSQVIINKGDIGHHMYFVSKGEVEVLSDEFSRPLAVLKEGDLFGEINLVYSVPCTGTVRARTHCDILLLSKADTAQILQHFPEIIQRMKAEVKKRCGVAFSQKDSGGKDGGERGAASEDYCSVSTMETERSHREGRDRERRGRRRDRRRDQAASGAEHFFHRLCKWWIAHPVIPGSKFATFWDLLITIVTVTVCWVYSFEAGFSQYKASVGYGGSVGGRVLFGFTYLLDLILVADILVSMKKALVTPTGVVTNARRVCLSYVCSYGFLLDTLAVLPLEVVTLGWHDTWGYVALLRLNRLLKVWKLIVFFDRLEGSLYISVAHVRALKFTIYILTTTHIGACIWFPLACFSEGSCLETSWAASHKVSPNSTGLHDYIMSIYWASATMTTVGYGDVRAHNVQEMVLALIIQLIGVMLYGYCLGAIAATLANTASPRITFQEKMQVVHQFMHDHNLGKGLLERVDHYFILLWRQFRGEAVPGGQRLMHDMPRSVQEDVSMEESATLLNTIPFFRGADISFIRSVSITTSTYLFAPGDIILYSGDMGREMYCIKRGYVEILAEDLSQVVTVHGPGGYFGELGFLFGSPRSLTVRAATHCELLMLMRRDLDNTLEAYPLIQKQFEDLSANKQHLQLATQAAADSSDRAVMNAHRHFSKPCILTALAVTMTIPLSPIIRIPIANTIAACVGGKDAQSKVSCPISVGEPFTGSLVRFSRKELGDLIKSDQERRGSSTGLRRRRGRSRSSITPATRDSPQGGHQQGRHTLWQRIAAVTEKVFSYCLIPYTFIPTTRPGELWEFFASLLAFLGAVTFSLQAAFLHDQPALWVINYCSDLFFFTDMVLKLHTAYYNAEGVLITQPLACAKYYLKTSFFLDMLSSFPTDIIVLSSWHRDISDVLRVLSLARLNRIIRIYKVPLAFQYLEDQIARSTGAIKEAKFALYMMMGTHWTACGWFVLACASLSVGATDPHTCNVDSWALKSSAVPLSNYSIAYQYIVSLYWATATTTTVGYGDIHAHTDLERTYATFVMVVGVVAYGYIIASVAASLANADSARAQYQDKLKAINSYMQDQNLDSSIKNRVVNYYEYIWQRNKGVSFSSLFQGMPISLQADISLSLYKKIIDQVPLFQNTEIGFTKLLALSIKPVLFLSKEYVVRKGDIGSEMFFINRGMVEVVSEDGTVVFATMNEGKFFGEISLVFSCPRTASIRAATNCDLFVLTKRDLDRSLVYYPEIAEQIREVAGNRANLVKKRSEIAAKAAAEGKSASDAAKAAAQGTKGEEKEETKTPAPSSPPSSSSAPPPAKTKASPERKVSIKPQPVTQTAAAPPPADSSEPAEEEEEELGEERRPPSALRSCYTGLREKVWPVMRRGLVFTIPHDGTMATVIHLLGCLMAYFSAFTISYQAAFQNNAPWLWAINYLFELYFTAEIFVKFHLSYEDAQGRTVNNFKSVARHYLKDPTGFPLDLVAVFPYELIALAIPKPDIRTAVVLYLRLPHVLRAVRIQGFFSREEKRLNQRTVLLRLLKFIVLITLCTHFVACIWYIFGCQASRCRENTWALTASLINTTVSDADHYCSSLYWAVATLTSTGYGDLSATNVQEMLYAIAVMVFGKLLFGFILGSIASTLANLDTQRVLFEEKLFALKDYMREQHLPSRMQQRVLAFFDYIWVRNKGTDRRNLLGDMPYCMQAEVSLATTEALLKEVPIFASADAAFLRHLTLMVQPCLFLPGEHIVHQGDVGLGMFFLFHGTVEVLDENDPQLVAEVLQEGGYFGQKSLIYNTPMESSVRAVTHVDMFTLSQSDFEKVLQVHPTMEKTVSQVAQEQYGTPMTIKSSQP